MDGRRATRGRLVGGGLALAALALCAAAPVPRVSLESGPALDWARRAVEGAFGADARLARVRLELLPEPGIALDGLTLDGEGVQVRAPLARVRPDWGALVRGSLRPALHVPRFAIHVEADDGPGALARLAALLDERAIPVVPLSLRRGTLYARSDRALLDQIEIDAEAGPRSLAFHAQARQLRGGRLDLRGRADASGQVSATLYLDGMQTRRVDRWVALAIPSRSVSPPVAPLLGTIVGRAHAVFGAEGGIHGEFSLAVSAREAAREGPTRAELELVGSVGLSPGGHGAASTPAGDPARFAHGSWVHVRGDLGRLRDVASGALVSGPFEGTLLPSGSWRDPSLSARLDLSGTHVEWEPWLRKPAGLGAALRIAHRAGGEGAPRTLLAARVGTLRATAELAGLRVRAQSEWLPVRELATLVPALEGRLESGRVRVRSLDLASADDFRGTVELDGVGTGRREALSVESLRGVAFVSEAGLDAPGLEAIVGGVPIGLDFAVLPPAGAESRARVRFGAEIARLDVRSHPGVAPPGGLEASELPDDGALPAALREAAYAPIALLREQIGALEGFEVERGTITADSLRAEGETLDDVELEFGLRGMRLDLRRVAFRRDGRLHAFGGSIDLRPLVPRIDVASLFPGAAALDPR